MSSPSTTLFDVVDPTPPEQAILLQNRWSFWHDKFQGPGQTAEEYQQSQKEMFSFNTVQVPKLPFVAIEY